MRQIIVTAFMSLDGVMEAPDGEAGYRNTGWTFTGVELDEAAYGLKGREQLEAGGLLLGAGRRLFSGAEKDFTKLDLVEHATYGNCIQMSVYDVVR